MKIKTITWQHRRDFFADLECEHCGFINKNHSGYDDDFYHSNVIPNLKCTKCGKSSPSSYRPLKTKYDANQII